MKRIRKIIDILMTILFIILMGYHITGNKIHEILGVTAFILFIIHNILNVKWYKAVFKGKYNFRRVLTLVINIALLIAFICMMLSGIMISSNVFVFLGIKTTSFSRKLHLVSTSWGFVLMSLHLGLHLNVILSKINKKIKASTFEYIYYLILILIAIFGLYSFINNELWKDMLLITEFKFFDYNQSPYLFYLGQVGILVFISFLIYLPLNLKKGRIKQQ